MRARRDRAVWFEQGQPAPDGLFRQIELDNFRSVPQSDKGARAVPGDGQGNGEGSGHGIALGKIEPLFDFAAGGVYEQNVIGKIVGHQQLLSARGANDRNCSGVWHALVARLFAKQARHSSRSELLKRQTNHALWRDLSLGEAIDQNAAAGRIFAVAEGVSERGHTGVDAAAVAAERQAGVKRLMGFHHRARVREVGERAGLSVQHSQRLLILRFKSAVACVHRDHVAAIWRNCHGDGQAVQPLRMPRNLANQLLAAGQIDGLRRKNARP